MKYFEVQADGLIGASHNYAGLSFGNVASTNNEGEIAKPKQAALQGLDKMRFVSGLGVPQLILPPPIRPNMKMLSAMGVALEDGATDAFAAGVVKAAWSAASMWSANAATISPAANAADGATHITIANLASSLHRQQEAAERYALFERMFVGIEGVKLHQSLPACTALSDEGAADHMLLCPDNGVAGVEIFVYGKGDDATIAPKKYPARQTLKASQTVARLHHLPSENCVFAQQHPQAIDAGVFHNDVIAMSNLNTIIYHEYSFADEAGFLAELKRKSKFDLQLIRLSDAELPLADAVRSYFYNSQLLSLPNGKMCIVAPIEAQENALANAAFERIKADGNNNITALHFLDVRESMKNGGGPACLRLRIMLNEAQIAAIPASYHFNERNYEVLSEFINANYPDEISPEMLFNVHFAKDIVNISNKLLELF